MGYAPQTNPHKASLAQRVAAVTLCAGLLLGLAFAAASSRAQTIDDLNARIAAAQSEAEELGAAIDSRSGALAAASARARAAAQREAVLSTVLARGQEREARLQEEVADTEAELAEARERLRRATRALASRLVAIYKSGVPDATTLLLDADGFDDLATRADLLDRIRDADAALVSRVRELREEVATKLAEVSDAEARAEAFNNQVADARDRIASVRAGAEAEAAELVAARQRQQAALEGLQSQVGAWTSEVQRLEQVSAEQAQQTVASWVGDWAIPQSIVMCESGGNFEALNASSGAGGAYQILPSTWRAYGGSGLPHQASAADQHRIASQIWRDSGSAAWVC